MRSAIARVFRASLASLLLVHGAAQAAAYTINLGITGLSGAEAVLAVDFVDGGSPNSNGVVLGTFTTGGTRTSTLTTGSVAGSGPWVLYDGNAFNELLVGFNPSGSSIAFTFSTTDYPPDGGTFPDAFSVFLLNAAGGFLVTTNDPTGANALLRYDLGIGSNALAVYTPAQAGVSVTVTASSTPPVVNFPLAVARTGSGSLTSNPVGIACGADCAESYAFGTRVTLPATPAAGWIFDGWSGACSGTGFCSVSMFAARDAAAVFRFVGAGSAASNEWVQKAYVAYYGRPADPGGLGYWASRLDAEGGSLSSIIVEFGNSDEFNRRYGGLTHVELVTRIYRQILGRDPEQGGLDYYVGELQSGRRTLQSITLDVLGGATGSDALTVANRLDVANHFTGKVAVGCAYGGESTGVSSLAGVTPDLSTVWSAKAAIEGRCGP